VFGGSRNFYPFKSEKEFYNRLSNYIIHAFIMDTGILEYMTNNIYHYLTLIDQSFANSAFRMIILKE
jgi:hypothetical protein